MKFIEIWYSNLVYTASPWLTHKLAPRHPKNCGIANFTSHYSISMDYLYKTMLIGFFLKNLANQGLMEPYQKPCYCKDLANWGEIYSKTCCIYI